MSNTFWENCGHHDGLIFSLLNRKTKAVSLVMQANFQTTGTLIWFLQVGHQAVIVEFHTTMSTCGDLHDWYHDDKGFCNAWGLWLDFSFLWWSLEVVGTLRLTSSSSEPLPSSISFTIAEMASFVFPLTASPLTSSTASLTFKRKS